MRRRAWLGRSARLLGWGQQELRVAAANDWKFVLALLLMKFQQKRA